MLNIFFRKPLRVIILTSAIGWCSCSDTDKSSEIRSKSSQTNGVRLNSSQSSSEENNFTPAHASKAAYNVSAFSGKAEIATYKLDRARYDSNHPGKAILIFVSEPFLWKKQQVKADNPKGKSTVNVLKMNRIDRFTTGVYDYSMYTSVFTPIESFSPVYPMKVTFSSQDWCGQAFAQINNDAGFRYRHFSYFQNEGDEQKSVDYSIIEDNIMNLCRISDTLLPAGDFQIIPSLTYLRTAHQKFQSYAAHGSIDRTDSIVYYNYEIPELKRNVRLKLDPQNNNQILSWTESYPTIFDGKIRTSTYRLQSILKTDYWNFNSPKNVEMRKQLNLN